MSSGLYVPHRDIKYPAPGAGVSIDGRLCSKCNKPSRSKGGGLIDGRWYCAADKPKKEKNVVMTLSKWTQAVHAHCLSTGTGITPQEALSVFGNPPTKSSASSILNSALQTGWFRREEWTEPGAGGSLVRRSRYFAVDKLNSPSKPKPPTVSYFTGIKRCRSVFELGSAL